MCEGPCEGIARRVLMALREVDPSWTQEALASFLGFSDHTVPGRWLRAERDNLGIAQLRRILADVRPAAGVAMLRALVRDVPGIRVDVETTTSPTASLLAAAAALNQAAATLTTSTVEATADGRVDERERREGEHAADRVEEALHAFRAALRGAR